MSTELLTITVKKNIREPNAQIIGALTRKIVGIFPYRVQKRYSKLSISLIEIITTHMVTNSFKILKYTLLCTLIFTRSLIIIL